MHNYFQTIRSALLPTFYRSKRNWRVNGRLQSRKYLTHQCTKMLQRGSSPFLIQIKLSKLSKNSYLEPGQYPSITDNVEAGNTLIQARHKHIVNLLKRNLQSVKRNRGKFLKQGSTARLKKNKLEARKRSSGFRKRFIAQKRHYSSRH